LPANTSGADQAPLAVTLAVTDPDLRRVVTAWPTLPDVIRQAVLGLIVSTPSSK
jgi:hypothetical protein